MNVSGYTERELVTPMMNLLDRSNPKRGIAPDFLCTNATRKVQSFHRSVPGYSETPLVSLKGLADKLGVKEVFVKDESKRFGLNAFKGLGGSFALGTIICQQLGLDIEETSFSDLQQPVYQEKIRNMVFATATDGNHGKGISWSAGLLGCKTHVYMPRGSSEVRAQAIRDAGLAHVEITDMNYDDTVCFVSKLCEENGWIFVQDTSWPGYEEIPTYIAQGYTTIGDEMVHQLAAYGYEEPTHVFLQAGVGAMAGAMTGYLVGQYAEKCPDITIVEPESIACIYESAKKGLLQTVKSDYDTIMAGLNCGSPCTITWPTLRDCADHFLKCPDWVAAHGMRTLANPIGNDPKMISGESGAATIGALSVILECTDLASIKQRIGLDENSVVVLISTEGDTDPQAYRDIVEKNKFPSEIK